MQLVSVFTPTYNRLELIKRLYVSLEQQTVLSFEWVVVDDDSSDGTDEWIASVAFQSSFTIKYEKQPHGGKHRAINRGVMMAENPYVFFVDSDDYLPRDAIETIESWLRIPFDVNNIAGVAGLRVDTNGVVIGEAPKTDEGAYVECGNLKRYKTHLMGDKAEVYRRDLLMRYPFPEFQGEYFVTERLIWDRISADGYMLRWYNQPVYICEYQGEGLSNGGANSLKGHLDNYQGYLAFVRQSLSIMDTAEAVTVFREYNAVAKAINKSVRERAEDISFGMLGYILYLILKMPLYYLQRYIVRMAI